mmetsp:Transcript_34548/g.73601  ORF Transcript_34548/g.73601 Transcript_34548/m.73601 type:complete len:104 (+) Transcript_34548:139-450(+)
MSWRGGRVWERNVKRRADCARGGEDSIARTLNYPTPAMHTIPGASERFVDEGGENQLQLLLTKNVTTSKMKELPKCVLFREASDMLLPLSSSSLDLCVLSLAP